MILYLNVVIKEIKYFQVHHICKCCRNIYKITGKMILMQQSIQQHKQKAQSSSNTKHSFVFILKMLNTYMQKTVINSVKT